jgi:hypothetical protein
MSTKHTIDLPYYGKIHHPASGVNNHHLDTFTDRSYLLQLFGGEYVSAYGSADEWDIALCAIRLRMSYCVSLGLSVQITENNEVVIFSSDPGIKGKSIVPGEQVYQFIDAASSVVAQLRKKIAYEPLRVDQVLELKVEDVVSHTVDLDPWTGKPWPTRTRVVTSIEDLSNETMLNAVNSLPDSMRGEHGINSLSGWYYSFSLGIIGNLKAKTFDITPFESSSLAEIEGVEEAICRRLEKMGHTLTVTSNIP